MTSRQIFGSEEKSIARPYEGWIDGPRLAGEAAHKSYLLTATGGSLCADTASGKPAPTAGRESCQVSRRALDPRMVPTIPRRALPAFKMRCSAKKAIIGPSAWAAGPFG
jgi:hypothetical protein